MKRFFPIALALLWVVCAHAQVQTDSFSITVTGQNTWTIRYGIGDSAALALQDIVPGQPRLDQSIWADITGTALDILTLEAHFDNKLGPAFQSFVLRLDRDPWHGELGDFSAGDAAFGIYNKQLLGLRLTYAGEGYTVAGLAARQEGVADSRTFHGQVGHAEVLFSYENPDQPWEPAPYRSHIEGLAYFELREPFIAGFSEASLSFSASQELWSFLDSYGLGYLRSVIEAEPTAALGDGDFLILGDQKDVLILRTEPAALLRGRIQAAIEAYNDAQNLIDEERKEYPFVMDSDLEREFLKKLADYAAIEVDSEAHPLSQAAYRRYLYLGEKDVLLETLAIWVRRPEDTDFLSLYPAVDPKLAEFSWTLYEEEGVIRIDFPESFFAAGAALRTSFDYRRTGNVFMLGLAVVPGSERVYLNGKLLTRGTDYTIDYEIGVLILFSPLSSEDELRVDFERQRGGLGGYTAEYEQGLFGITVTVPGWNGLNISASRAMDFGRPRVDSRTMPNAHTVLGVQLQGDAGGWKYALNLGGSENVFPPGDNVRFPDRNRINAIAGAKAPDGVYTVFAHQGGITAYHAGEFANYTGAQGLAGRAVRDLLPLSDRLLCATDAGLTVVRLWDAAPFDRVASWVRIYRDDGLPGDEVFALAQGDGLVYLATLEHVAVFSPALAEDPKNWTVWDLPEEISGGVTPTALAYGWGELYLGTNDGLFFRRAEKWERVPGVAGQVHDLLVHGEELYVATGNGIRILHHGVGSGWLTYGTEIYSSAWWDGVLWYATGDGAFRNDSPEPVQSGAITALGVSEGALWAGGAADEEFQLDLWRLGPELTRFLQEETKIDGRDESRFWDIPAAEHTRQGVLGNLSLSREMGKWRLGVNLGSQWPGYQAIGSLSTADSHGFGLSAAYSGGELVATLQGQWDVVNLFTAPQGRLATGMDLGWSPSAGTKIQLGLTPILFGEGMAGFSRLESGYRFGASWSGAAFAGEAYLVGNFVWPDWFAAGRVTTSLTFRPATGWNIELRGLSPFRTVGHPGDQELTFTARWTDKVDLVSWTASFEEAFRRLVTSGDWQRGTIVRADVRFATQEIAGGRLFPQASLTWQSEEDGTRLQVQGNARLDLAATSLDLGVTLAQGVRPATEVTDRSLGLTTRWEHRGWGWLRPSLSWQGSWRTVTYRGEERTSSDQNATLRLSFQPTAPWRNELTLSYKGSDASISLTDKLTWPFLVGNLSVETTATWREKKLEGSVIGSYGQHLTQGWDLGAEVGYILRANSDDFRQGIFGGISINVSF